MKTEKINKYCEIVLDKSWLTFTYGDCKGYFRGYLYNPFIEKLEAAKYLTKHFNNLNNESISVYLNSLRGHYSFILEKENEVIACVDISRSIPLNYMHYNDKIYIFSNTDQIIDKIIDNKFIVSQSSALSIAMSGCTIGEETLFSQIKSINAGEFLKVNQNNISNCQWYQYLQYKNHSNNFNRNFRELDKILNRIFDNIITSCNGKTILIPLSAGLDSRLVASFLRKKNYSNVICFSYGQKGNFEAYHAKRIANVLGFKWFFIEINYNKSNKYYASDNYIKYLKRTDSFSSCPVSHELLACEHLKKKGYSSKNTVIINGMPGDFFTGGHIPKELTINSNQNLSANERKKRVINLYVSKHFSLWEILKTPQNVKIIKDKLENELSKFDLNNNEPINDYIYYEYLEFMNRQSKIIMSNQRVYDFYDYDWRVPFFDYDFINFWKCIGIKDKNSQKLYVDYLEKNNLGGVWKPIRKKTWVSPRLHRFLRVPLKAIFYLFANKSKWEKFNKKYLEYLNDVSKKNAIISWSQSIKDTRGWRNANSWLVERYLNRYKIKLKNFIHD